MYLWGGSLPFRLLPQFLSGEELDLPPPASGLCVGNPPGPEPNDKLRAPSSQICTEEASGVLSCMEKLSQRPVFTCPSWVSGEEGNIRIIKLLASLKNEDIIPPPLPPGSPPDWMYRTNAFLSARHNLHQVRRCVIRENSNWILRRASRTFSWPEFIIKLLAFTRRCNIYTSPL